MFEFNKMRVRRVFIMDDGGEPMPEWMYFIKDTPAEQDPTGQQEEYCQEMLGNVSGDWCEER